MFIPKNTQHIVFSPAPVGADDNASLIKIVRLIHRSASRNKKNLRANESLNLDILSCVPEE